MENELWNHMAQEHDLTLTESQLREIVLLVEEELETTLRDRFALAAMPTYMGRNLNADVIAKMSYDMAGFMLEARTAPFKSDSRLTFDEGHRIWKELLRSDGLPGGHEIEGEWYYRHGLVYQLLIKLTK